MEKLVATRLHKPLAPDTQLIVSLSVLVLIFTYLWQGPNSGTSLHSMSLDWSWWKLWTSSLGHADIGHLFANLLFFTIFGALLYGHFGWLAFPVLPMLVAGLIQLLTLSEMHPEQSLVGASGIVYYMGGFWLTLQFFVSREKKLKLRWVRFLGFSLLLFAPSEAFKENISYLAHLIGFSLGIALAVIFYTFQSQEIKKDDRYESIPEDEVIIDGVKTIEPRVFANAQASPRFED